MDTYDKLNFAAERVESVSCVLAAISDGTADIDLRQSLAFLSALLSESSEIIYHAAEEAKTV